MGRSPGCCRNPGKTRVRNWTSEEDKRLRDYIQVHGEGCWSSLPKAAGLLRCGKSCRLRWANHLRPHLKRGNFAEDEDELIMKLHALLGNKWSLIAGRLPGRTDNEIKNYWNVHLKRKLLGRGVDPQTHRPIQHQHQQHRHLSPGTVDLSSIQSQSVHDVSEAASGTTDDHPELNLELCIGTLASSHADQGNGVRADSSNDMESGGRTSAKDDLKVLIKPVCHRVDRLRPRTLLLLR